MIRITEITGESCYRRETNAVAEGDKGRALQPNSNGLLEAPVRIIEDLATFKATNLVGAGSVCCRNIVDKASVQTGLGSWNARERDGRLFRHGIPRKAIGGTPGANCRLSF